MTTRRCTISWKRCELVTRLEKPAGANRNCARQAGVEPFKLYHPLKLHDWLVHDYVSAIQGFHRILW